MSGRVRGQDFLTDISSLVGRVRTLELVTFGEDESPPSVQESIVVGSISVPVSSALSATAAEFAPAAISASAPASASASVSVASSSLSTPPEILTPSSALVSDSRKVYVTPLADRLRGGAPSGSEQTSGSVDMLVIKTAEQFLARWAALNSDAERKAFELEHSNSPEQVVVNEAVKKCGVRTQLALDEMQALLMESRAEAAAARAAADAAIAAQANQVNHSETHKPKPPPSFENKEKDLSIQKWLPVVENHLNGCADKDYLRIASSYLGGKPRSFWQSKYDLRLKEGTPIENPPEFFRETMLAGYGLKDEVQTYWDTWAKLRQAPGEDISDYNIAFEQARTDLADEIHDEAVLVEKYKAGLQKDIRELARVSPSGKRWTSLSDLITYCTLQWPTIQARLDKGVGGSNRAPSGKVGGKRKAMSPNRSGRSSKASSEAGNFSKLPRLSEEQKAQNIKDNVCHLCRSPDHYSNKCPTRQVDWKNKKGKNGKRKDFS